MTEKLDPKSAEDILKKYDKESDTMMYKGVMAKIVSAIAITFSIFQLYTATFGVLDAQLQRAVHLGFGLALFGRHLFLDALLFRSDLGRVVKSRFFQICRPCSGKHLSQEFFFGRAIRR